VKQRETEKGGVGAKFLESRAGGIEVSLPGAKARLFDLILNVIQEQAGHESRRMSGTSVARCARVACETAQLLQIPQHIRKTIADLEWPIAKKFNVFDDKPHSLPLHDYGIFPSKDILWVSRINAGESDGNLIPLIDSLNRAYLESRWPFKQA